MCLQVSLSWVFLNSSHSARAVNFFSASAPSYCFPRQSASPDGCVLCTRCKVPFHLLPLLLMSWWVLRNEHIYSFIPSSSSACSLSMSTYLGKLPILTHSLTHTHCLDTGSTFLCAFNKPEHTHTHIQTSRYENVHWRTTSQKLCFLSFLPCLFHLLFLWIFFSCFFFSYSFSL